MKPFGDGAGQQLGQFMESRLKWWRFQITVRLYTRLYQRLPGRLFSRYAPLYRGMMRLVTVRHDAWRGWRK